MEKKLQKRKRGTLKKKQTNLAKKFKRDEITKRFIPQTKLEEALRLLKDEEQMNLMFRQNLGCTLPIHLADEHDKMSYSMMLHMKDMQNCLMQRDWCNLARMLSLANPNHDYYYGFVVALLTKYATILLSYNDKKLLGILSQSVLCEDNIAELLRRQTMYPKEND